MFVDFEFIPLEEVSSETYEWEWEEQEDFEELQEIQELLVISEIFSA
jgi:hypothetical protein